MGLGLSNLQRDPWALDSPTACNDSKRVTLGFGVVGQEVACPTQWLTQRGSFRFLIKAGPTLRQEQGVAVSQ